MKYIAIVVVVILAVWGFSYFPAKAPEEEVFDMAPFTVLSVKTNDLLTSPAEITGEVPGTWYFEASFPVTLLDANGGDVLRTHAEARSDWMTESPVPFKTTLTFTPPSTDTGTLVLEKDNPSGLARHADEVRIPIRFR